MTLGARVPPGWPTALVSDVLVLRLDHPGDANVGRAVRPELRAPREEKGWTQESLPTKARLASVQISRVERGVREVRLTTLLRLIAAWETTPGRLLDKLWFGTVKAAEEYDADVGAGRAGGQRATLAIESLGERAEPFLTVVALARVARLLIRCFAHQQERNLG